MAIILACIVCGAIAAVVSHLVEAQRGGLKNGEYLRKTAVELATASGTTAILGALLSAAGVAFTIAMPLALATGWLSSRSVQRVRKSVTRKIDACLDDHVPSDDRHWYPWLAPAHRLGLTNLSDDRLRRYHALHAPVEAFEDEWEPKRAAVRALLSGTGAAILLAIVLAPLPVYLPYVVLPWVLRTALAFGVARILFAVVERVAGMAGWRTAVVAVTLTFAVLMTHHMVFAIYGAPCLPSASLSWLFPAGFTDRFVPPHVAGQVAWGWFHPYPVTIITIVPCAAGCVFHLKLEETV